MSTPAVPTKGLYARSRALIIGVSAYQRTAWRVLPGVEQDVAEVAAALKEHGFELTLALDPDLVALRRAFETFLLDGMVKERDRLLVYYAGHGHTCRTPQGVNTGYLVPVDAPDPTASDFRRRALALDTVHQYSREVSANHVLFLFDSCFSGELLERPLSRGRVPPANIEEHVRRPVRQFITSGEADESVPDRSVFRSYFVQALRGEVQGSKDGFFTASQLASYLFDTVVVKSKKSQHPQYGKIAIANLDKGDFVFEVPPRWLAERSKVPEPPSSRPEFEMLEQAAAEIEPQHKDMEQRWSRWLKDLEEDFAKGLEFEKRPVPTGLKSAFWRKFLSSYSAASPFTDRDRELRADARRRIALLERTTSERSVADPVSEKGAVNADNPLKIRFRSIPPQRFRMGSPEQECGRNADEVQHEVRLTRGFWIGETVVTRGDWSALMGADPSHFSEPADDLPVESVTWYSAILFANRLSESAGLEPSYELEGCTAGVSGSRFHCDRVVFRGLGCSGFRLPTEAEWELAARAGTETAFWTGDDLTTTQANYDGTFAYRGAAGGVFRKRPTPVRSFVPNPWGLYDVHGNVAEWVWDVYGEYPPHEVVDPLGAEVPSGVTEGNCPRVIRGGGWLDDAAGCRSADRLPAAPDYLDSNVGFRLVCGSPKV